MTPRRLDIDSITAKLQLMDEALELLDSAGGPSAADLREDGMLRGAVERYLMLLVDQAVAINLHVAAALGVDPDRDYTASFAAAADVGAIPTGLAEELAGSAGMRNVLVHEYVRVDLDLVAAALPHAIEHYRAYVGAIAGFLRRRETPGTPGT